MKLVRIGILLGLGLSACASAAVTCAGSTSVGRFQIYVEPPGRPPLPIRNVSAIREGYRLAYQPLDKDLKSRDDAEIAVVLVPPSGDSDKVLVLEAKSAAARAEWKLPITPSIIAVVYGPQGLNEKKVARLVKKDDQLVAQLAEYAERTQQTETTIDQLSSAESEGRFNAAIQGFSSQGSFSKIDRTATTQAQMQTAMGALKPGLTNYDPLATDSKRMQQSVGLAASVAGLFFGNGVGLAAGGVAMLDNLRTMLFPRTEFRSAFTQTQDDSGLALCAKRETAKSRTRLAYLWAVQIPNVATPEVTFAPDVHVLTGMSSTVPAKVSDWKHIDRARNWKLGSADVSVRPAAEARSFEIDLRKFQGSPGTYQLNAQWDWNEIAVAGTIHVHDLPDLTKVSIPPASQDKLIERRGPVTVKLDGPDFEFLEKITLRPAAERNATPQQLTYTLPIGPRRGAQPNVDVDFDTAKLAAGNYTLLLVQSNGKMAEAPVRILLAVPTLSGLPFRVNSDSTGSWKLEGTGLDRIESLSSPGAEIHLENGVAMVTPSKAVHRGDRLDVLLHVQGMTECPRVAGAIEVMGPKPRILSDRLSLPEKLPVEVKDGELPAGVVATVALQVQHVAADEAKVTLQCGDGPRQPVAAHAYGSTVFLSFDPGTLGGPGCPVSATVEGEGPSDPFPLGRVLRLPVIDKFHLLDEQLPDGNFAGVIEGQNLETIEKVGWDASQGIRVDSLPAALSANRQSLRIALPWPSPSPHAPLFIWLRGETRGRATSARY